MNPAPKKRRMRNRPHRELAADYLARAARALDIEARKRRYAKAHLYSRALFVLSDEATALAKKLKKLTADAGADGRLPW